MPYPIQQGRFTANGAANRFPQADNSGGAYNTSVFAGKSHVRLTGMKIVSDPAAAAAASIAITIVDKDGNTLYTWAMAKNAAVPRDFKLKLKMDTGFGINTGAADVTVLATYEIWD